MAIRVPRPRALARRTSSARDRRNMQRLKVLLRSPPFVKKAPRVVTKSA